MFADCRNRTTKRNSNGRELEQAGTRAGTSWDGRVLKRELERDASDRERDASDRERDASDREREQVASYRVASWLIGERELAGRRMRAVLMRTGS